MMKRLAWSLVAIPLLAACGSVASGGCPNDLPTSCPSGAPGYAATIAPLLEARCVSCHGPGGVSSEKPLGTWAEVSARRSSVLDQVYACRMPQPPAVLPPAERAELLAWLVCGAPDD